MLNREEACYYKNLLILGIKDGYDEWLNYYLETEDPLSDIVLELSYSGSDMKRVVTLLHKYCQELPFDESVVSDKLRLFFKDAYYSNRMSREEILSTYHLARNLGCQSDFDINFFGYMCYLDDYYSLAKEGVISWDTFDSAFFEYLDSGDSAKLMNIWDENTESNTAEADKASNSIQYMPIGMCLGLSVGMAIGAAFDSIGIGMCLGVGIGMSLGVIIDANKNKKG